MQNGVELEAGNAQRRHSAVRMVSVVLFAMTLTNPRLRPVLLLFDLVLVG